MAGRDMVNALKWTEDLSLSLPAAESKDEQLIISILKAAPNGLHIDELCRKSLVPVNKMGSFILNLELRGIIKPLPGKKFALVGQ